MKKISKLLVIAMCLGFLFSTTSCVVVAPKDSGKHKGWYKNTNNPHHPYTTNPGKAKNKTIKIKKSKS